MRLKGPTNWEFRPQVAHTPNLCALSTLSRGSVGPLSHLPALAPKPNRCGRKESGRLGLEQGQRSRSPALSSRQPTFAGCALALELSTVNVTAEKTCPPWQSRSRCKNSGTSCLWLVKPNDEGLRSCPKQETEKRGAGGGGGGKIPEP